MNKIFLVAIFFLASLDVSWGATNASSFKIKIKRVAVSTSGDCSSPIIVYDSGLSLPSITPVDLVDNPTLFANASVPNGTYNCVIWEVSDWITFTPSANDGSCVGGTPITDRDICGYGSDNPGNGATPAVTANPNKLIDGSTNFACTTTAEDVKPIYFSTWSNSTTGVNVKTGVPPTEQETSGTADKKGIKLAAPIVINGSTQGIFQFDSTGAIGTWNHDYNSGTPTVCSPTTVSFSIE